tara:strand:+ start:194 stop:1051 length:858 start_codon:yes stop_codon:yes gene_type:complete
MDISITELDDYLKRTESSIHALRSDCKKKIVWASEPGVKSDTSVVYIHGFSATRFECSPVIEMVAVKLVANLFFTRLRGHGQDGRALGEASFDEFMEDTLEAIEIGNTIGDEVIVVGCSTGCSLIHLALSQGVSIKSAIYISPNFGPKPLMGQSLRLPGAEFFVPLIFGKTHSFIPKNSEHTRCWTTSYPTKALFVVRDTVLAAHQVKHREITTPMLFWFSDEDKIVNAEWTRRIASKMGINVTMHNPTLTDQDDPSHHCILGDILSPSQTEKGVEKILNWLSRS